MSPKLSIIIPCYNTEGTLNETLVSVFEQNFSEWEAIIVNDGSKDNLETIALNWVEQDSRFKYFEKENGGLGTARNYGIKKALGSYILPLDSDNKIRPDFAKKALGVFESDSEIGVIFGNAEYFGERTGIWNVGKFDILKLLRGNYIDACSIIKKEVFDLIGLYDIDIPFQGQEDWEFWLRVSASEYKFYYLNEITFDYRVEQKSMIRSYHREMRVKNENYIRSKHAQLYISVYKQLYDSNRKLLNRLDTNFFVRLIKRIKNLR